MPATPSVVGLNALFLDPRRSGGPETYLRQLAPALAREFPKLRLVVATTRRGAGALRDAGWTDFCELVELPADEGQRARRTLAEQLLLPVRARRARWDVLHSLGSVAPVRAGVRSVITLHDVTFLRERTFGAVTTWGMGQVISRAARHADALITGSAAARDEICRLLHLDPGSIAVVPHGAGRRPSVEPAAPEEVGRAHRLDGTRPVLCVAAKRPHKNQELLVRAARHLPDDVVVVLAGHPEPYDLELRRLAEELGVAERLRFVDYVPDEELEALWSLAGCAAFPTLGEGFGLPLLEAMSRGVAVACSDISVLREVGGDAAHYFDPRDPQSAATAILAALDDDGASGPGRAALFSWEAAARGTFEAYERALAGPCT